MYTTLELLKQTKACIPGYTRMITYFGTSPKMKAMRIPLWMVGLIGDPSDLDWTVANAMVIDDKDFAKFRAATLRSMIANVFYYSGRTNSYFELSGKDWNTKNPLVTKLREVLHNAETVKEIEDALTSAAKYSFDDQVWSHIVEVDWNRSKTKYVQTVLEYISRKVQERVQNNVLKLTRAEKVNVNSFFDVSVGLSRVEQFAALCLGHENVYDSLLEFTLENVKQPEKFPLLITKVSEDGKEPPSFHGSLNLSSSKQILQTMLTLKSENPMETVLASRSMGTVDDILSNERVQDASQLDTMSEAAISRVRRRTSRIAAESTISAPNYDESDDEDTDDSDL